MMENKDVSKKLQDHERRISALEKTLGNAKKPKPKKSDYTGVGGGIRLLIDNRFLDTPKFVSEIAAEMKREGYYHDLPSIDSPLRKTFLKNRMLQRIKEGKKWKYVIRK